VIISDRGSVSGFVELLQDSPAVFKYNLKTPLLLSALVILSYFVLCLFISLYVCFYPCCFKHLEMSCCINS